MPEKPATVKEADTNKSIGKGKGKGNYLKIQPYRPSKYWISSY
jgi:hypothetical protein